MCVCVCVCVCVYVCVCVCVSVCVCMYTHLQRLLTLFSIPCSELRYSSLNPVEISAYTDRHETNIAVRIIA